MLENAGTAGKISQREAVSVGVREGARKKNGPGKTRKKQEK